MCDQTSIPDSISTTTLQNEFLSVLPRIELHARISFRDVRCPARKDDLIQETVAIAWESFQRTSQQGKDPTTFVSAIARYAVLHVRNHRNLCGTEKSKDAMSKLGQHRSGFTTLSLSGGCEMDHFNWEDALRDNSQTPIPEQVVFRVDFPRWLSSMQDREQQLVGQFLLGESNHVLAQRFGISRGRISQLRRELYESWQQFCDG